MGQYLTYLGGGLLEAAIIFFSWRFSGGPMTSASYFLFLSGVVVAVLLAPTSVYLPKLAAVLALLLTSTVVIACSIIESWHLLFSPLELLFLGVSLRTLFRYRSKGVFAIEKRWSQRNSAVLIGLPLALGLLLLSRAEIHLLLTP